MPDRNESPPAKISHGTASIVGLAGAAAAVLPLLIDALTDERLSPQLQKWLLICGTFLVGLVILIRGAQAVAVELTRGR